MCPDSLVENLFTTAAIDGIDHNETSSTSSNDFHGQSTSVFPHYDNLIKWENIMDNCSKADHEKEKHFELTLNYNDISPVIGVKSQFLIFTTNEYPENIVVIPVHEIHQICR